MKKSNIGILIVLFAIISSVSYSQTTNFQQYNVLGGNGLLPGTGLTATNTGDFIRNSIFGTRSSVTGISLYVNNLEKMRMSSSVTYIYNDLNTNGNFRTYGPSYMYGNFNLCAIEGTDQSGTAYVQARDLTTTSNIDLLFRTKKGRSIIDVMRLTQDGKVGIGTSAPQYKLDVTGDIRVTGNSFLKGHIFLNAYEGDGLSGTAYVQARDLTTTSNIDLQFRTKKRNSIIDVMRLTQDGRVGIGTANPDKGKLHIRGSLHVENEDGTAQVFHVSAGKQLVFVGDSAYIMYNKAIGSGEVLNPTKLPYYNNYSLWVSHGIVTEDIVLAKPHQWDDYVFNDNYKLQSLPELEKFIKTNKHLPNMPSETDLKQNGYTVHQMNRNFVKTVEELTLYVIDQQKKIYSLDEQLKQKNEQLQELKGQLDQVKSMAKDIETLKAIVTTYNSTKH